MSVLGNISRSAMAVWSRNKSVFLVTWKTNFLPPFLEPILYLVAMGFAFGMLVKLPAPYDHINYAQFIAAGLVANSAMYGGFYECTYGSFVRMHYQKTYEAIVATPLNIEEVIAGEIVWGATKSLINGTIVLLVTFAFGLAFFPGLVLVPVVAFLAGMCFASIAMIFTALVPNLDSFNYPFFLFITPMSLISGTFFPINILPGPVQALALAFPLTHVASLMRGMSLNLLDWNMLLSLAYLAILTLITFYISIYLMRRRLVK